MVGFVLVQLCCTYGIPQPGIDELETLLAKVQNSTKEELNQAYRLTAEYEEANMYCYQNISKLNHTRSNVSDQLDEEIEKMKRLQIEILKSEVLLTILAVEAEEVELLWKRVELVLNFEKIDGPAFIEKRSKTLDKQCEELKKTRIYSQKKEHPMLRGLLRDSDEVEVDILWSEIRRAKNKLRAAQDRVSHLQTRLQNLYEECQEHAQDLANEIAEISGDVEKAKATVNRFTEKHKNMLDKIKSLTDHINLTRPKILEGTKVIKGYEKRYMAERACYQTLTDIVLGYSK